MAFPTKTLAELERRIRAHFRAAFPTLPVGPKRFLGRIARAIALVQYGLHKAVEDVAADIVPSAFSSRARLEEWATLLGLPNGAGGIGALVATTASGGQATISGTKGTVFTAGMTATAVDAEIKLVAKVTIPGSGTGFGTATAQFVATTAGTVGNLEAGTVCSWDSPPPGADSTFVLSSPLTDGTDVESNSSLFERIRSRMQSPPLGGAAEDYREWLRDVDGIAGVYVYPRRSGTGTVDIILTAGGSGIGRVPSDDLIDQANAAIGAKRPVGAERVGVYAPDMTTSGHSVWIRVLPSPGYEFDWDDTATIYYVDLYTADPAAPTLRLNTLAPSSLKNAIDAYGVGNGDAPRLQVTNAALNPPVRAVAYADAGGKTTLTLEPIPAGWNILSPGFHYVYAYGPAVIPVAASVQSYLDALGPSRASGFSDALMPWDDAMTVSGLIGAAERAVDSNGSRPIAEVKVGGALIDAVAQDKQSLDQSVLGPQLLYASWLAVTQ